MQRRTPSQQNKGKFYLRKIGDFKFFFVAYFFVF